MSVHEWDLNDTVPVVHCSITIALLYLSLFKFIQLTFTDTMVRIEMWKAKSHTHIQIILLKSVK